MWRSTVLLARRGVWALRVHDVRASRGRAGRVAALERDQESDQMTDELTIPGIECFGHHGVFDFERREGQIFVIDLTLGLDTTARRRPRTTCATPSTTEVSWPRVKTAVETDPVDLIETSGPTDRGCLPLGTTVLNGHG